MNIEHSKMEIPEKAEDVTLDWLNSIFKGHGIFVHDFKLRGDASHGKGFMGSLEKVELEISHINNNIIPHEPETGSRETLHIILKTLPSDPFRKAYAANDGFCSREISIYTELFQAWDKFLDARQVPPAKRFRHPICYYGGEEGSGDTYKCILVLENLTAPNSDYHLWSPGFSEPLPWLAASAVIRQIARMHATGLAYKLESRIESYYKAFPKMSHIISPYFQQMFENGFEIAKDVIRAMVEKDEIPDGLMEQLDKLKSDEGRNLILRWFMDPTMDTTVWTTVCHNDIHSNNLVLSTDHSKSIVFDYQAVCSFNPMKDLSFFLIQNCELEDYTSNLPRALQLYHDEFEDLMKALKVDLKYTIDDINDDFERFHGMNLVHVMTGAQVWITGPECNDARKTRYSKSVIDAFKRGVLRFPTSPRSDK